MARARNIKPGFFKNEDLAECSPWARLCFAGLWTLADREGRLEDRPKRIKGELFAFDSIEVEPLIAELAKFRFIVRYAVEGLGIIQIAEFLKHQNPHHKEPESVLPSIESPRLLVDRRAPKPRIPSDEPQWHEAKAPDKPEAFGSTSAIPSTQNRAESPIRSPDPGILIPDPGSLIPELPGLACVAGTTAAAAAPTPRGNRLSKDWQLPKAWGEWALAEYPQWRPDKVRIEADKFRDHWVPKTGKDATKTEWLGTWRNWCRSDIAHRDDPRPNGKVPAIDIASRNAETRRLLGFGPEPGTTGNSGGTLAEPTCSGEIMDA